MKPMTPLEHLREIEYCVKIGTPAIWHQCPACGAKRPDSREDWDTGHLPDCHLAAAIEGLKERARDIAVCKEMAKEMIDRDPVKSAWIFWDIVMRETAQNDRLTAKLKDGGWIRVEDGLPKKLTWVQYCNTNEGPSSIGSIFLSSDWDVNHVIKNKTHYKPIQLPRKDEQC